MIHKVLSLGFVALLMSLLAACTAVEDAGVNVSDKFERGVTGQGRLISPNPTGDQYGSFYQ